MSILLTSEYCGPISSYLLATKSGKLIVESYENYQKKSYRNRAVINSPNGEIILSVPLQSGKNAATPITEVKISYADDWIKNHLKAMETGYRHSPFYEYYIDDIEEILRREHLYLFDLNAELLDYFIDNMHLDIVTEKTKTYQKEYTDDTHDMRKMSYRTKRNINIKSYRQPFDDKFSFLNDLSVLDLLFCVGTESVLYLQND